MHKLITGELFIYFKFEYTTATIYLIGFITALCLVLLQAKELSKTIKCKLEKNLNNIQNK